MNILIAGILLFVGSAAAQDLSKLDANTATSTIEKVSTERDAQFAKERETQLAGLQKDGVQIIKSDVTLNVAAPTKIAFAWAVTGGQKADKSRVDRKPFVITLYPAKDATGKEVAQKWEVNYKTGTAKAVGQ